MYNTKLNVDNKAAFQPVTSPKMDHLRMYYLSSELKYEQKPIFQYVVKPPNTRYWKNENLSSSMLWYLLM